MSYNQLKYSKVRNRTNVTGFLTVHNSNLLIKSLLAKIDLRSFWTLFCWSENDCPYPVNRKSTELIQQKLNHMTDQIFPKTSRKKACPYKKAFRRVSLSQCPAHGKIYKYSPQWLYIHLKPFHRPNTIIFMGVYSDRLSMPRGSNLLQSPTTAPCLTGKFPPLSLHFLLSFVFLNKADHEYGSQICSDNT